MRVIEIVESLSCVEAEKIYVVEGFILELEIDDAFLVVVIAVGNLDATAILILHIF